MCLILTVRVPATQQPALVAAAQSLGPGTLHVTVSHAPHWPWARPRDAEATVSEAGACACSLLADDADWNAPTWSMRPEIRTQLARTLESLAHVPGAVVEALWVGDRPDREDAVTPAGLAALAEAGILGTRTRYVVSGAHAS